MRPAFRLTLILLVLIGLALPALAIVPGVKTPKGDVYVGYARLGANSFAANSGALNGLEGAVHFKVKPFLGIEADVSQYGFTATNTKPTTTAAMIGPRLTVGALGWKAFAHALAGGAHSIYSGPATLSNTTLVYGLGAGVEMPLFPFIGWRVTGDYLRTKDAAPVGNVPVRISTGLVVKF